MGASAFFRAAAILTCLTLMPFASVTNDAALGPIPRPRAKSPALPAPVTNRPGHLLGHVLVLEYHRIGAEESAWTRSVENFRADLERLYRLGYRPVTMSEYVENRMNLPPGASPVVITFDDSTPCQFRLLSDGRIDPSCAVGIWLDFARTRPDFPVKATFYVLPPVPFGQKAHVGEKLRRLREWGSEIGSHTVSHRSLDSMSDEQVLREFAGSIEFLAKYGVRPTSLALPYGRKPRNADLLESFRHRDGEVGFRSVTYVGARPALSPVDPRFRPHRIPRVLGTGGSLGVTYWLDRVERGLSRPYVEPPGESVTTSP